MGQGFYVLLGIIVAVLLLVAALRQTGLRRYAHLLDPDAPQSIRNGSVRGLYSERKAQIGLLPSSRGTNQPPKVQISIETPVELRIEAHTESMAVALRKAVGVVDDRSIGDEELDRRFALQFDDRKKTQTVLARFEARQSLLALADLGADLILLTNGTLTVEIPSWFIIPARRERLRQVMAAMGTFLSAAESALSVSRPVRTWKTLDPAADGIDPWPATRPSGSIITAPVFLATFFVGIGLAIWLLGPFWDFNGHIPWQVRLDAVMDRLPRVALFAGVACLIATLFVPGKPLLWALQVSWPLVAHAALVGVVYVAIRLSGVPELQQALGQELEMIPAGLGTAAAAAGVGLGGGFAGAILGKRLSRMAF